MVDAARYNGTNTQPATNTADLERPAATLSFLKTEIGFRPSSWFRSRSSPCSLASATIITFRLTKSQLLSSSARRHEDYGEASVCSDVGLKRFHGCPSTLCSTQTFVESSIEITAASRRLVNGLRSISPSDAKRPYILARLSREALKMKVVVGSMSSTENQRSKGPS